MSKKESVAADPLHAIVLLPCPFCGSPARCWDRGSYSEIECDGCDAIGPCGGDEREAAERWNKRRSDGLRNWLKAEGDKADAFAIQHSGFGSITAIVRRDVYRRTEKQCEKLLDRPVGP